MAHLTDYCSIFLTHVYMMYMVICVVACFMPSFIDLLPCCTLFSTTYFPSHFHPLWHNHRCHEFMVMTCPEDSISQIPCPSSICYTFSAFSSKKFPVLQYSLLFGDGDDTCPVLDWALSSNPSPFFFFYCFSFTIIHCMKKHQDHEHHYSMDLNWLLFSWKYAFISFCTYAL